MSRPLGPAFASLLLLAVHELGCAAAPTPPERAWTEITSRHFTVTTDAEEEQGREITRGFERSYAALRSVLRVGDTDDKVRVHAITSLDDYSLVTNQISIGRFLTRRTPVGTHRAVLLALNGPVSETEVFQHELTHHFVSRNYPNAPVWLNEGLAQVLSTLTVEDGRLTMGAPLEKFHYDGWQWSWNLTPLADLAPELGELREMTPSVFYGESRGYAGSFLLVHTLLLGGPYRAPFDGYLAALRGGASSEVDAFNGHFQADLQKQLARDFTALAKLRDLPTEEIQSGLEGPIPVTARQLTPSEAHVMWASLRPNNPSHRQVALAEAERAIALDPKNIQAYLLRASVRLSSRDEETGYWNVRGKQKEKPFQFVSAENKKKALADLRQAAGLERSTVRAKRALGHILLVMEQELPEVDRIAAQVAPVARDADDFDFLASWEIARGSLDRAIERGLEGARADAGCIDCYETAAKAAAKARKRELALDLQQRAINVAAEDATPEMFERLKDYRAIEAPAPGPPGISGGSAR